MKLYILLFVSTALFFACSNEIIKTDLNNDNSENGLETFNKSCGNVPHDSHEKRIMYKSLTVPYGSECVYEEQIRICNNGVWSPDWTGSFTAPNCSVSSPHNCGAENKYYSLHEEPIDINNQKTIGFLNIYHPDNLKNVNTDLSALPLVVWGEAGVKQPLANNPRFKIFIPPGAIQINLIMYCQPSPEVKTVVRFGRVPDCFNCTSSQTDFSMENTYNFDKFATEDIHLLNAGGQIIIYSRSLLAATDSFSDPPPIKQGGWLYVYAYNQAIAVGQIQYGIKVDKNIYTNWYNSYDTNLDEYGLKQGYTCNSDKSIQAKYQQACQSKILSCNLF